MSNKAKKETKFSTDIDNLTSIGEVNNLMVGAIYGHKDGDL